MRNSTITEQFDLDREFVDFSAGNHSGEIPRKMLIDMCWNTATMLFFIINDYTTSHRGEWC